MRVLQIVSHYVPAYHYGGVLHVAHSLSKALVKQGHEVHVCTSNLKNPQENLELSPDQPIDVDGAKVYYEGVQITRYWGFSLSMLRRIWMEAAWADIIFIHFHYQFASIAGGVIARMLAKPYIIFTHGSLNQYGVAARSSLRKKIYINLLERKNFTKALFVAYHSVEEMDSSFKFGISKIVPNGIDPLTLASTPPLGYFRQRYPESNDRTMYLYLGRLDVGKGLDLLLPAFKKLTLKHRDVHLILAGGDERGYATKIRHMIEELGLSNYVTMTGLISGPEKMGALQDADVYVLPSRSEGLSISMLEAMYMKLPVIVTDRVGLWRQIHEQQCGVVVSLDETELANALEKMTSDLERNSMGERGNNLVRSNHTWDIIARNLIAQIVTK